jgi:hypothetical protein
MSPIASYSGTDSPAPDKLIAGEKHRVTVPIILLSGENRTRGAVLGRVAGAISAPAAGAGNTGNGAFAATPTPAAGIMDGQYRLVCIEPAANAGVFQLEAPDGRIVGRVTVAVAYAGPHLAFTLNDGAADFIAGDFFTIDVAKGTKYKLAVAAATDGSHRARGVLNEDVDATAADKAASLITEAEINKGGLIFGAGHTAATVEDDLLPGIVLRDNRAN